MKGRVFACETNHPDVNIDMKVVAVKLYRFPETVSMTPVLTRFQSKLSSTGQRWK